MSTMTKLPSESFWPMGHDADARLQFPKLTSDSSTSVISPLTLPRGVAGYFDQVAVKGATPSQSVFAIRTASNGPGAHDSRGSRVYSPLSPGARDPALQHTSFLSPHLLPITRDGQYQLEQYRSSSLPPKSRSSITSPTTVGLPRSPLANAPMSPTGLASAGHPRSISADAASAPSHAQMIRRLVQQNGRIREAWEAERKYLEANRERAEEVYKEERAFMEEERAEWDAERAALLQEIQRLQQQVSALGGGAQPAPNGTRALSGASFSGLNLRGGTLAPSEESPRSSQSSQGTQSTTQSARPIVRNGESSSPTASRRLDQAQALAASKPNGPSLPTSDFLKPDYASDSETTPVPIVDVQEIHPELEGIPIKATTVQKPTFTLSSPQTGSQTSSRSGSPPSRSARGPKEQTLQVLAAKETERLTMHAGHTPSHSLSALATNASSGTATASSNGGDSTPTMQPADLDPIAEADRASEETQQRTERFSSVSYAHDQFLAEHHPEALFEPTEDRELKGPLMVRNVPAHDEIFFQKLSDKLEEVRKDGEAALPAVLKDSEQRAEQASSPKKAEQKPGEGSGAGVGEAAAAAENDRGSSSSGGEETPEIPLKFKTRMNFGAPFGAMR